MSEQPSVMLSKGENSCWYHNRWRQAQVSGLTLAWESQRCW